MTTKLNKLIFEIELIKEEIKNWCDDTRKAKLDMTKQFFEAVDESYILTGDLCKWEKLRKVLK